MLKRYTQVSALIVANCGARTGRPRVDSAITLSPMGRYPNPTDWPPIASSLFSGETMMPCLE